MLIRELLSRDPKSWSIPNLGVAKVGRPRTDQEWDVLKYELQVFVAEGEYEAGLKRILTTFLKQLDSDQQPAAWISGFYGSGKSHLARVLDAIWSDPSFPDGARASGLVRLPQETAELVKELRTRQRQHGGAFSAAGTLSAGGGSVRLAVLALVFAAADLPEAYPAARAVLWMESEGVRGKIEKELAAKKRSLTAELTNMYVSEALAEAIRATVPGYAESAAEVRKALRMQFPPADDISQDKFLEVLDLTLRSRSTSAGIPLTLIVLDELQQFMNEDKARTAEVQQVVEACSSRFGSRLLFVGTGQLQMGSTPQLAKLRDRFQVRVTLKDTDVDRVVRSVVLRKDPEKVAQLKSLLSTVRGEIDRQLAGTKIGPVAADADDLIADYPLLPARRRFWESILRSVDSGARAGQLRTQLRIVLEATKRVADRELGFVIPADVIYDELESDLQMSGILPRETATGIAQLAAGNDGLAKRIAGLVFLIGKLPKEGPGAPGLRASTETIADLLIDDLRDAGALRQRVPDVVRALLETGKLIEVEGQLLVQTPTASEWQAEFRRVAQSLRNDDAWLVQERAKVLQAAMTEALARLKPTQGSSRTPRKFKLHFGSRAPEAPDGEVPVWVRDEWTATQKEVVEDARQAGVDSPIVLVFLPKIDPQQFASRLAEAEAADRTINARPVPTSDEAMEARAALASRRDVVRAQADEAAAAIVAGGLVFQAGGNDVSGETLADRVGRAVENGLLRIYPLFSLADDSRWSKVIERTRQGSANPLAVIDHQGSAAIHPVGSEIRQFVGAPGKRGIEVRKHFLAPPYGWPQDAVDGGLLALVAEGEVTARHNGQAVSAKQLPQNAVGAAEFRTPSVVVSAGQRIAVRVWRRS